MTVHVYEIHWSDFYNRESRNRLFAHSSADAVELVEDLAGICSASWVELREDGQVVTVTSQVFNQPATSEALYGDFATLELRAAGSGSRHELKLHSVAPQYVNIQTKTTRANPFRDLAKLRTADDDGMGELVRGVYGYKKGRAR